MDRLLRQPRAGEPDHRPRAGEVFVHRNVGNVVVQTDLNCLSVIQFAVDLLKVKHIMVVGHYGCGGVDRGAREQAGRSRRQLAAPDRQRAPAPCRAARSAAPKQHRHDRLCELNVLEQVVNVCRTTVVQDAWLRGQELTVHGWIYGLRDGLARDLASFRSHAADAWPDDAIAGRSTPSPPTTEPGSQHDRSDRHRFRRPHAHGRLPGRLQRR